MNKQELISQLLEVIEPEYLPEWLETKNLAFDHRTVNQVIEDGDGDLIEQMIEQIKQGAFE